MKRRNEPLKGELQGLQMLCAAGTVVVALQLGARPRGDDLVIGVLAGMLLGSWVTAVTMKIEPRVASAVLDAGWAVRLWAERSCCRLTAVCFRVHQVAERRGLLRRCRLVTSACRHGVRRAATFWLHHLPVLATLRRCWAWLKVDEAVQSCRAWWASRRLRHVLAAEAQIAVARRRLEALYRAAAARRARG